MPRKPNPERRAELESYTAFFRAFWKLLLQANPWMRASDTLPDGSSSVEQSIAKARRAAEDGSIPFSQLLTGVRQGVADALEMSRDFSPEAVRDADAHLVAVGAPSLTEMRRRVWRVIPKVLERGRIRNVDEYYVVKNTLDDVGDALADDERNRLDRLRFEFEERAARARPGGSRGAGRSRR